LIRPRSVRVLRILLPLALSACSSVIPSLGPGLRDNAVAYHASISDINDQVLLSNIVRARDFVPLNITELSTVTGTLSEQASLGLSIPFGGGSPSTARGIATPSIQAGSAPTFSMAALNTRGFTLNIIQPISPVYVASKWNTGISHELLLLLFIKDIVFADSYARSAAACASAGSTADAKGGNEATQDAAGTTDSLVPCHHKFVNNPDSPGEESAFKAVIESMLPSVGIKVMTILEPVGPAFPFLPARGYTGGINDKKIGAAADTPNSLEAFALTTHIGDGQYHVGDSDKRPEWGQLYRVYANQVAICAADPVKTIDGTFYIYPVGADIVSARHAEATRAELPSVPFTKEWEDRLEDFKAQCALGTHSGDHSCDAANRLVGRPRQTERANAFGSYAMASSAIGSGVPAQDVNDALGRGSGQVSRGAPSGGSAMPAVAASLQQNRVGAFLRVDDCYADQTIRERELDTEFRKYTDSLGHIEWRSVAEVFQYLGAVLRHAQGITWSLQQDRAVVGSANGRVPETMFMLRKADSKSGDTAQVHVKYRGEDLAIGVGNTQLTGARGTEESTVDDQSLIVLSLLSELVNSAKISSDIPVSQQLQVLP
jgi:hypothetical protein